MENAIQIQMDSINTNDFCYPNYRTKFTIELLLSTEQIDEFRLKRLNIEDLYKIIENRK